MSATSLVCDRSRRLGFTLIEVCLSVVVLMLLSGVVWLSLRSSIDDIQLSQFSQRVASGDGRERSLCSQQRRSGGCRYNSSKREIVFLLSNQIIRLPRGVSAQMVRGTGNQDGVRFSEKGLSPSYAIRIEKNEKAKTKSVRWIAVLGLTGQTVECTEASDVEFILGSGA